MMVRDPIFADPLSNLALAVFRCNGALIALGDSVVAPLGLTSARWQVLGSVIEARGQLSVASIARNMGLVRQSVQRVIKDLASLGLVRIEPNPHHRRAHLVQVTQEGERRFECASAAWLAHTATLSANLPLDQLEELVSLLGKIRAGLGELAVSDAVSLLATDGG
jgi:DNA-binding MarR family transcriptional regulator